MKKFKMNLKILSVITLCAGAPMLLFNFLYFSQYPEIYAILNLVGAVIIVGIPLLYRYSEFKKIRKIEEIFPKYLNDIAENISAGMTLPQAIRSTGSIDYGVMNPYVHEMASKVTWGITFEKIMEDFAKKTGSKNMRRNVQTIIETHRSGGSMDTVLKSVGQSLIELERIKKEVPKPGVIGVFNRSHYEDIIVPTVWGTHDAKTVEERYARINAFELELARSGVKVVKIFLHVSKDVQRERLQARIDRPEKNWKFAAGDLETRKRWNELQKVFGSILARTSTWYAPWNVVAADDKPRRDLAFAKILRKTLQRMGLAYPESPDLKGIKIPK